VVDLPVLCLVGDRDGRATPEDAAAWKEHTSADFLLRTFPGGHFFLTEHQETVARLVTDWAGFAPGGPVPHDAA
jgi:surfactin synthase thioesterase subunit